MIHTKTTTISNYYQEYYLSDSSKKKIIFKDLIDDMPIEELEKIVQFNIKETGLGTEITATIELIDV